MEPKPGEIWHLGGIPVEIVEVSEGPQRTVTWEFADITHEVNLPWFVRHYRRVEGESE